MAANVNPIFTISGDVSNNASTAMNQAITAAAANYDGTGANNSLIFTADATNGSFVQRIRAKAIGTNTASVARIFINNGSTVATATNNSFYGEFSLPATTQTNVAATIEIDYPMNIVLAASFRLYVGIATAVAAGWVFIATGGKF